MRTVSPRTPQTINNPIAIFKLKWATTEFHVEGVVIPPAKPAASDSACQTRPCGPKRRMRKKATAHTRTPIKTFVMKDIGSHLTSIVGSNIDLRKGPEKLATKERPRGWGFRLRVVSGPLIGEVFHNGEALSGEARFGDRVAQVVLPSQIVEGTTRPILLQKGEPEYSAEARKAKLQGTVHLSVLIDATGRPAEFHVLHGLGMGLDEKAIEALRKWQCATRFVLVRRASIADGLDTANLENGVVSVRDRSPPHDHLMPQVFGETFRGEAIRLQIRENYQCFGAHQDVAALLFIHASLQHRRRRLGIGFSRGLLL